MLSAAELHERAQSAANAGRLRVAATLLARARGRAVDPDQLALLDATSSYVESELGDPAAGLTILATAEARVGLRENTIGILHCQRGMIHMRAGNAELALTAFDLSVHLCRDDGPLGRAFLNRGLVHLQLRATGAAASDFSCAADHFRDAGLGIQQAKARHNLGYVRLLRGELADAVRVMDSVRGYLAPISAVNRAVIDQDRAEMLIAAGMPGAARVALESAVEAFGSRRLRQSQAEAELMLARALLPTDVRRAGVVARRSGRRFAARGSEAWSLRALAVASIATLTVPRPRARDVDSATGLVVQLRAHGLGYEADSLELYRIRALVRMGEVATAASSIRRVDPRRLVRIADTVLFYECRMALADALGDSRAALRQAREGATRLQNWHATFASLELQSTTSSLGRELVSGATALALRTGRSDVALEWVERQAMASRVVAMRPPPDPEIAEALAELRYLATLGTEQRARHTTLERSLRRRVRERSWYASGSGRSLNPVRLAALREALRVHDAALVAHIVSGDRLAALVVTRSRAQVVDLGPVGELGADVGLLNADLDMCSTELSAAFGRAVRTGLRTRLTRLSARLIAPLTRRVGDRPIVVVPPRELLGVPWTILPGLLGRPVTVPRSATAWVSAVSDPSGSVEKWACRRAGFVAGPHIVRADAEVRAAAATWPDAEVLTGPRATATAVAELVTEVDLLHIAAHGRHSADNPLFSGLELADGVWFGYDVDRLARVPRLVVLSACELGRATVNWQEEGMGMAIAWLHAGAECVIASTSVVSDDIAHDVLGRIHVELRSGRSPAAAVAAATADPSSFPAPFVCYGQGL